MRNILRIYTAPNGRDHMMTLNGVVIDVARGLQITQTSYGTHVAKFEIDVDVIWELDDDVGRTFDAEAATHDPAALPSPRRRLAHQR